MTSPAELRDDALRAARDLNPETMTGEQAARVVRDLATAEKACATAEKACATARMFVALKAAQTEAWRGEGHQSAADWLAAQLGINVGAAAAQLSTAKKASRLPKTKEAMRRGNLSPEQAGAVADAATADPSAEDELLDTASRDTTANLKKKAAKTKAAATDTATRERRIRAQRSVRRYTDAEGAYNLHLRGPGLDGVNLEALLRPYEERRFQHGRKLGEHDTFENRSYDALIDLLTDRARQGHPFPTSEGVGGVDPASMQGNRRDPSGPEPARARATERSGDDRPAAAAGSHTDGTIPGRAGAADPGQAPGGAFGSRAGAGGPGPDTEPQPPGPATPFADRAVPERKLPGGNGVKVIVRIDHTALARGHTIAGETCDVAGVGPISVATAKALMPDAFLAAVITKGTDVVNVAHIGRALNAHQRTAVEAMGLRCSNIACNRTLAIQIDHRVEYAVNRETKLDNQDPLCPECHRRKTHHGWHLEPGVGPRRFLQPDPPAPPRSSGTHPGQSDASGPPAALRAGHALGPPDADNPESFHRSAPGSVEQQTLC